MAEERGRRLLQACKDGDLDLVRRLVNEGCNPRDVRDGGFPGFGGTPLHKACRYVPYATSLPPLEAIKCYAQP